MDKYVAYLQSLEGKVIKKVTQPRDFSPVYIEFTDGTIASAKLTSPEEVILTEVTNVSEIEDYN